MNKKVFDTKKRLTNSQWLKYWYSEYRTIGDNDCTDPDCETCRSKKLLNSEFETGEAKAFHIPYIPLLLTKVQLKPYEFDSKKVAQSEEKKYWVYNTFSTIEKEKCFKGTIKYPYSDIASLCSARNNTRKNLKEYVLDMLTCMFEYGWANTNGEVINPPYYWSKVKVSNNIPFRDLNTNIKVSIVHIIYAQQYVYGLEFFYITDVYEEIYREFFTVFGIDLNTFVDECKDTFFKSLIKKIYKRKDND